MDKKKIVILTDWYLPGFKAGGPIKSISSIVKLLKNEFVFFIITTDRDFGDNRAYNGIKTDTWVQSSENENLLYLSPQKLSKNIIKQHILEKNPDLIYCNSLFSYHFSIIPVLLLKKDALIAPILLAPRGMLGDGALQIKSLKKKVFLSIFKLFKAHKSIFWHSTSKQETDEIKNIFGNDVKIFQAGNLQIHGNSSNLIIQKNEKELKLLFLSRVSQKKNLLYALERLNEINVSDQSIAFDIAGPIEDSSYWNKCEILIKQLSKKNIQVNHLGAIESDLVKTTIEKYHFLFLPTLNENYGHVIVESLFSSRPIIISNQTPWRELEKYNAGWDIDLNETNKFVSVIEKCIQMNDEIYQNMCKSALDYAKENCKFDIEKEKTMQMFYSAMKK